jgi:hypothetical protein
VVAALAVVIIGLLPGLLVEQSDRAASAITEPVVTFPERSHVPVALRD